MRADRLITLLLLLQRRGRVTAADAAAELEVSERTARRDLEALAQSGVPIYSKHGRGGGWQLIGGAKTDLSGLSADEAQALFLAAGPALDDTPQLKSALRKLTSALPETFRADAEAASTAIKIDPGGWGQLRLAPQPRFLEVLTDAVVKGRQVRLGYDSPRSGASHRVVHPLGLVTKGGVWYLVASTDKGRRTFRLSRVRGVEVLNAEVIRPPNFDLDQAWTEIVSVVESRRHSIEVRAWVDPGVLTPLRHQFAGRITVHEAIDSDGSGWVGVTLTEFAALPMAAQLAGYGNKVRLVDAPSELLQELARIAKELQAVYQT